jgi:hypothetical protein
MTEDIKFLYLAAVIEVIPVCYHQSDIRSILIASGLIIYAADIHQYYYTSLLPA